MRMRFVLAGLAIVTALTMQGCGGGGVAVSGKVVNGDKPYSTEELGDMTITMAGGAGKAYTAKVQPDGTFKVDAEAGGVAAGSYKVSFTQYPSKAEMAKLKGPPTPKTKETSVSWDVTTVKGDFTLDVSKAK